MSVAGSRKSVNARQGWCAKRLGLKPMTAKNVMQFVPPLTDTGEGMSDKELRNQIFTPYLAGHETTAVTMTWVWSLLSQSPHVEAALHDELDSVLSDGMVVQEAMRLYPPVWGRAMR